MNDITRVDPAAIVRQLPALLDLISQAASLSGAKGAVPKYLTLAATLLRAGTTAYHELTALKDLVSTMVAEKRQPTKDEWDALAIRSTIAHETIQGYDIDKE